MQTDVNVNKRRAWHICRFSEETKDDTPHVTPHPTDYSSGLAVVAALRSMILGRARIIKCFCKPLQPLYDLLVKS